MKSLLLAFIFITASPALSREGMLEIPKGEHIPFLSDGDNEKKPQKIAAFLIDEYPVTNAEFNKFLLQNKKWKKSLVSGLFADQNYLKHWKDDSLSEEEKKQIGEKPIVNISWFAAKAYCKSLGKSLPSLLEWEYASDADNKKNIEAILKWYGTTNNGEVVKVEEMQANKFGPKGMHGHIWEWVDDFNSVLITQDSRGSADDKLEGLFCGGGSLGSKDSTDYASFMRYAFRSGLDGQYTYSLLGFRCAKNKE